KCDLRYMESSFRSGKIGQWPERLATIFDHSHAERSRPACGGRFQQLPDRGHRSCRQTGSYRCLCNFFFVELLLAGLPQLCNNRRKVGKNRRDSIEAEKDAESPTHERERTTMTRDAHRRRVVQNFDRPIDAARRKLPVVARLQIRSTESDVNAVAQIQLRRGGFVEDCLRNALTIPTSQNHVTATRRRRRSNAGRRTRSTRRRHAETRRQTISERDGKRVRIRIRGEIREMTTCLSKLARVVDDLNQVAFTQRGYLIAPESCECERFAIRANCGHTNGKRCVVARPFETRHTTTDGRVSRSRKTIQQPASEN